MKKLMLVALTSALSCNLYAGMMGGGDQSYAGFIGLEGGYITNQFKNFNYTFTGTTFGLTSTKKDKNYGGRVGAGMLFMMDDQSAVTTEIGWGYYGETTLNATLGGLDTLSIKYTLTGFDALIGLAWIQPSYSLFAKAGALIQNMQSQTDASFLDPAFTSVFIYNSKTNQSAPLPEIKVGGSFNFDTNWSLTAAAFYAFGNSNNNSGILDPNTFNASLINNSQNPNVGGILLGIQYTC